MNIVQTLIYALKIFLFFLRKKSENALFIKEVHSYLCFKNALLVRCVFVFNLTSFAKRLAKNPRSEYEGENGGKNMKL